VITGIQNVADVGDAFEKIKKNLFQYKANADFQGVRIMRQAGEGYDMFIGGKYDESFGQVVFFGYGGIYIEVFKDTANILCPADPNEIEAKVRKLKSFKMLRGARGKGAGDLAGYVNMIERVTHLLHRFPQIRELDINPVRVLADGSGAVALDARVRIEV
jgi:acyl-CoA synthetase (NDP forming)